MRWQESDLYSSWSSREGSYEGWGHPLGVVTPSALSLCSCPANGWIFFFVWQTSSAISACGGRTSTAGTVRVVSGRSVDLVRLHLRKPLCHWVYERSEIQPSKSKYLIGFIEWFMNWAASHLETERGSEELYKMEGFNKEKKILTSGCVYWFEREIDWLPPRPVTQGCSLTGTRTHNLLGMGGCSNQVSHPARPKCTTFKRRKRLEQRSGLFSGKITFL